MKNKKTIVTAKTKRRQYQQNGTIEQTANITSFSLNNPNSCGKGLQMRVCPRTMAL